MIYNKSSKIISPSHTRYRYAVAYCDSCARYKLFYYYYYLLTGIIIPPKLLCCTFSRSSHQCNRITKSNTRLCLLDLSENAQYKLIQSSQLSGGTQSHRYTENPRSPGNMRRGCVGSRSWGL